MENKINKIKHWLQRYGERDDDGFSYDGEMNGKPLSIFLQYEFGDDGELYSPSCLFKTNNKMHAEFIGDADEKEIDDAIELLYSKINGT